MASITAATGGSSTQLVAVWQRRRQQGAARGPASPSASAIMRQPGLDDACGTRTTRTDCFSSSWAQQAGADAAPAAAVSPWP